METNVPTDKYTSGLAEFYDELLNGYKLREISLLEIGVYKGGSMIFFENLLPQAKIYGFDILPRPEVLKDSRAITRVIDQKDSAQIAGFAEEVGGFAVVIDDGSHFLQETENCFNVLWPYVKEGGIYVIEDWAIAIVNKDRTDEYDSATRGMDNLVFEICKKRVELGITDFKAEVRRDWMSYAFYRK